MPEFNNTVSPNDLREKFLTYASSLGIDFSPFLEVMTESSWRLINGKRIFGLWILDNYLWYTISGHVNSPPSDLGAFEFTEFRGKWYEQGIVDDLWSACQIAFIWVVEAGDVDRVPPRQRIKWSFV